MRFVPKISVIMSIYNETEKFIKECFESLTKQTFSEFEVIVILDNPSRFDEIDDFIRIYGDDRFILHCNDKNLGLAESMNVAITLSSSDILARMDADDIIIVFTTSYYSIFCE